jgi:putative heme transporter
MIAAGAERPPERRLGPATRRAIALALGVGVVLCLVVLARGDVVAAVQQLGHVRWGWAAVAAAAGIVSIALFAGVRVVTLRAAGGRMGVGSMIGLTFASGAIAASVPAGGAVATAYTFREYRAAGADDGAATWALFVTGVLAPGVLAILGLGGIALASPSGTWAVLGPVVAAVALEALAVYVLRHPAVLVRPIAFGLGVTRRLRHHPPGDPLDDAAAIVARFAAVRITAGALVAAAVLQLVSWLVDLACLAAALAAVGATVPWRGLLAVFTASQLIGRIPLLPGGIGQIETGLVVGLRATGVPVTEALAATLVFRLASQWLIVPLGWPAWWWRRHTRDERPDQDVATPAPPVAVGR